MKEGGYVCVCVRVKNRNRDRSKLRWVGAEDVTDFSRGTGTSEDINNNDDDDNNNYNNNNNNNNNNSGVLKHPLF